VQLSGCKCNAIIWLRKFFFNYFFNLLNLKQNKIVWGHTRWLKWDAEGLTGEGGEGDFEAKDGNGDGDCLNLDSAD
jgi:hypothetical protein